VEAARKTGVVITAEEHSIIGGLGSAVCEVLSENLPTTVIRVGVKDTFGESGTPDQLMEKYGLDNKAIEKAVLRVLKRKA